MVTVRVEELPSRELVGQAGGWAGAAGGLLPSGSGEAGPGHTWPEGLTSSSHSLVAGMLQSRFPDGETKAHGSGPSLVPGSDETTLGASQACVGWAGEGEGGKAPEPQKRAAL